MGVIYYNGKSSEEFGIVVETTPNYEIPERDYEILSIPGRNGDVVIDKGNYKNVERSYNIAIVAEEGSFPFSAFKMANWLHSGFGYCRLEDSYNPEIFMMATLQSSIDIVNLLEQAGRATITFNRKPQRFLKVGEIPIVIESHHAGGYDICNPTMFESKPLIIITGSGNGYVNIGNHRINLNNAGNELYIDCEIEEAYYNDVNMNSYVNYTNYFPKLSTGVTNVSFGGGIGTVTIIPRWWTI